MRSALSAARRRLCATAAVYRMVASQYVRVFLLMLSPVLLGSVATAQDRVDGHVSLMLDHLPNLGDTSELRSRIYAETTFGSGGRITVKLSGFAEGLLADRDGFVRSGVIRPVDLYVDLTSRRFDVRAGFTRLVWGRLDEIQPGDIVNPLDIARFFLEGRSEARLPVALVRARWFLPGGSTLEGVIVPVFRRGRFDQLDESTSPFNLAPSASLCPTSVCSPIAVDRKDPALGSDSLQGGARLSATSGRFDWAVSAYRGLEPFGVYEELPPPIAAPVPSSPFPVTLEQTFPRFTMVSTDFETVTGSWALRGELAFFVDDVFQGLSGLGAVDGRSLDGGIGIERRAGDYRLSGNVLFQHQGGDPAVDDTHVSVVFAMDRAFARETHNLRAFGVYNASDRSAFLRAIYSISLRDNVSVEGSGGWFLGAGTDTIGRFGDRDFVYARLKVYF